MWKVETSEGYLKLGIVIMEGHNIIKSGSGGGGEGRMKYIESTN